MKRALVTGASKGIGMAIARRLQHAGHEVTVCSRTDPLTSESGLQWLRCDAIKPEDRMAVCALLGGVDILVNNVGGGGRFGTHDEVFGKNVAAMMHFTEWALPGMAKAGWGRVVTVSSIFAREAGDPRPIFTAAKAAQLGYMKATARLMGWARNGITLNTVCPGNVFVQGKPRVDEEELPMGRMGNPDEVAALVAFLCSPDAAYINGAVINVDGGESVAI